MAPRTSTQTCSRHLRSGTSAWATSRKPRKARTSTCTSSSSLFRCSAGTPPHPLQKRHPDASEAHALDSGSISIYPEDSAGPVGSFWNIVVTGGLVDACRYTDEYFPTIVSTIKAAQSIVGLHLLACQVWHALIAAAGPNSLQLRASLTQVPPISVPHTLCQHPPVPASTCECCASNMPWSLPAS